MVEYTPMVGTEAASDSIFLKKSYKNKAHCANHIGKLSRFPRHIRKKQCMRLVSLGEDGYKRS